MAWTVTSSPAKFKHLFEACRVFVGVAWYNSNMRSIEHPFDRSRSYRAAGSAVAANRRPGAPTPLRLTRRGRLAVVLLLLAGFVLAGVTVGRASSRAAGAPKPLPVVTVHPGETLWQIAARVAPHGDRRLLVQQLEELNHLADGRVSAGAQLRLPR
jgi:Tfp pilus assembly protein FimV